VGIDFFYVLFEGPGCVFWASHHLFYFAICGMANELSCLSHLVVNTKAQNICENIFKAVNIYINIMNYQFGKGSKLHP